MLFESPRIVLRKMTEHDIEIYHTWRNDTEVMQSTSLLLDVYDIEETQEFVRQIILASQSAKSYLIIEKESEKPIGITSLIHIDYKTGTPNASLISAIKHRGVKAMVPKR
jgi:RimJ/RimL family protein N-acetyltransferase